MLSLFPSRPAAQRLSRQTFLFDEYLQRLGYRPPRLERRAIVHGHCHRKALMGMQATQQILGAMGVEGEFLDSGCCGMAGSFGYERAHYDVSVRVGEHALLPRVRSAPAESIIVADGFSCREQIAQTTNRRAMHLSEVVAMSLPRVVHAPKRARIRWKRIAAAAAVAAAAAILLRRH
jgi:Fe-S oxidoreductase